MSRRIRVLALMESASVSGPAKNLIQFACRAAQGRNGLPNVELMLATCQRTAIDSEFVFAARSTGIPTFTIRERRPLDTDVIPQLKDIVLENEPDILQSHNVKSHFLVRLTGLYKHFPWVAFHHGYTASDLRDRTYNQVDRWSLRAAHCVVVVCRPFAERLSKRGVRWDRIRVLHNAVEPFSSPPSEVIEKVKRDLALGKEAVILCVGRLSHEKGHRDLLEAVARLARREDLPPFRVILIGDGPERERLRKAIVRLGLQTRLTITGQQRDVRPYYLLATLLALPSHTEGSPNVVLEAMAAGLPLVATAVGGVPEIVEQERSGLLVPPQDPNAMAEAIARLLGDKVLRGRFGAAGCERVGRMFSPEAYTRSLVGLYQEILTTHDVTLAD